MPVTVAGTVAGAVAGSFAGTDAGTPLNFWGETPATEEEFHASQGIYATKSFFNSPHGASLFTRSWLPLTPPRAAIFMIHGYGNDISWTFQYTPIYLARFGFACFALDLPGHGRSSGLRAFVPDLRAVVDDCISFFRSTLSSHPSFAPIPKFLYGESMGGALCLLIHLRLKDLGMDEGDWSGAILVAPMCKIADELRPRWPIPEILMLVARFLPALPVVPTEDLVGKSVKVVEKRVVAMANPMRYNGRPRLGTVVELLRATDELSRRLSEVSLPFVVFHGSGDVVTDPAVSRELYAAARSNDKSIKIYDGVWHSVQFGETEENVEMFRRDVLEWLVRRCGGLDGGKIEFQTEFEVGVEALWKAITKDKFDVLRKAAPQLLIDCKVLEGDGGLGTLVSVSINSAGPHLSPFKEKMVEFDEINHRVSFQAIEGGLLELGFAYYNVSFKLDDLGEGKTLAKSTIIYELDKDFDGTQVVKDFSSLLDEYMRTVVSYLQKNSAS